MIDLFGQDTIPVEKPKTETKYQRFKRIFNYRKSINYDRCMECAHCIRKEYSGKYYHKCNMMGDTNGAASDIRRHNVCDIFRVMEK